MIMCLYILCIMKCVIIQEIYYILKMGSCLRISKSSINNELKVCVPIKNELEYDVNLINKSFFYFVLRKQIYSRLKNQNKMTTQVIDLRSQSQFNNSHCYLSINIVNIEQISSQVRVLYHFRNLIIIDNFIKFQSSNTFRLIKLFKQYNIKLAKIFVLPNLINQFLEQHQYFQQKKNSEKGIFNSVFAKFNFPILLFDSQQLINPSFSKQKIYVQRFNQLKNTKKSPKQHSIKQYFCSEQLQQIILQNSQLQNNISYLQQQLKKKETSDVLVIYNIGEHQDYIVKEIMNFVSEKYSINNSNALLYFCQKFDKVNIAMNQQEKEKIIWKQPSEKNKQQQISQMNKSQEIYYYLRKYHKQNGKKINITQKAVNLINMLLDNLIKNPQPQQYRNIKTTNPQLGQYLFKFKNGKKLLESIGFFQEKQGNRYRNSLEQKYLKVYKTDIGIAYKKFLLFINEY